VKPIGEGHARGRGILGACGASFIAMMRVGPVNTQEKSFVDLGIPPSLVKALSKRGIDTPFAIQSVAIPDLIAGRNVLGRASTGSGKTLAFGLPILIRIAGTPARAKRPLALILVPTRELATQVQEAIEPIGRGLDIRAKVVVGGASMGKQIDALKRGVEMIVATPGRLEDLIARNVLSLDEIKIVVLDEADQMCDMGFLPSMQRILEMIPSSAQRVMFSATLDGDVDKLVRKYVPNSVLHSIVTTDATLAATEHHVFEVDPHEKLRVTQSIAARDGRTLLFVRTKHGADRLTKQLGDVGVYAVALHGGKNQNQRTKALADFRDGHAKVLVATDVAARGIHVDDVSLVLHVDPPADPKDYLHRAGRTARAGESGVVVTLQLSHQRKALFGLMKDAGVKAIRTSVAPRSKELIAITGAKEPSGTAVVHVARLESKPIRRATHHHSRHGDEKKFRPRGASESNASSRGGSGRGAPARSGPGTPRANSRDSGAGRGNRSRSY
jgi:superfamily II DNA/RNA helicase